VRVVTAGGAGQARRITAGWVFPDHPAVSPNGQQVAYDIVKGEIWLVRSDGTGRRRLTMDGSEPAWSPDGRQLAFAREDGIYVVSADGSGEKRVVRTEGHTASPSWSPDGRRIAFIQDFDLWVVGADGSDARHMSLGRDADGVAWSPNGRELALVRRADIQLIDADGRVMSQLTRNSVSESDPAWTPDGRSVAFTSEPDTEIFVTDPAGRHRRQLTRNEADDHSPTWSPDRTQLAFVSERRGPAELFVMKSTGSGQHVVGRTTGVHDPAWSPDGSRILYAGSFEVFAVARNGKRLMQLDLKYDSASAAWSPDGREIAITTTSGKVFVVSANGKYRRALAQTQTFHHLDYTNTKWSPTGREVAVSLEGRGGALLYVVAAPGQDLRRVRNAGNPRWSPDGSRITFERGGNIWVMERDRTSQHSLTASEQNWRPNWSGDGRQIGFTRPDGIWLINADGVKPRRLVHAPGVSTFAWAR
jgi:TolB protein